MSTLVFLSILSQLINTKNCFFKKITTENKKGWCKKKKSSLKKFYISINQSSPTPRLKKTASGRGFISIGSFEPRVIYKFSLNCYFSSIYAIFTKVPHNSCLFHTNWLKISILVLLLLYSTPLQKRWWIHTVYAKIWYSALTVSSLISLYMLLSYMKAANTENGAVTVWKKPFHLNRNHLYS